jgi:hypothetical protein
MLGFCDYFVNAELISIYSFEVAAGYLNVKDVLEYFNSCTCFVIQSQFLANDIRSNTSKICSKLATITGADPGFQARGRT